MQKPTYVCKFSHLIHTNILTQCSLNVSLGYHTLVSGHSYVGQRQTRNMCSSSSSSNVIVGGNLRAGTGSLT